MGLFTSTTFDDLGDLYHDQLQDLYDAEQRLTKAIPKMRDAAHSPQLKQGFEAHLAETERQIERLEKCFELFGKTPKAKTCEAIKGLIAEGDEMAGAKGDPDVKDAALIAAAQRVEHYEMAGYGCLVTFANKVGQSQAAGLLQQTLDEEGAQNKKLTAIAEGSVNPKAAA